MGCLGVIQSMTIEVVQQCKWLITKSGPHTRQAPMTISAQYSLSVILDFVETLIINEKTEHLYLHENNNELVLLLKM